MSIRFFMNDNALRSPPRKDDQLPSGGAMLFSAPLKSAATTITNKNQVVTSTAGRREVYVAPPIGMRGSASATTPGSTISSIAERTHQSAALHDTRSEVHSDVKFRSDDTDLRSKIESVERKLDTVVQHLQSPPRHPQQYQHHNVPLPSTLAPQQPHPAEELQEAQHNSLWRAYQVESRYDAPRHTHSTSYIDKRQTSPQRSGYHIAPQGGFSSVSYTPESVAAAMYSLTTPASFPQERRLSPARRHERDGYVVVTTTASSPSRARSGAMLPPSVDPNASSIIIAPTVRLPPPPATPQYLDSIDTTVVEHSYEWLVLRNFLRDVEEREIVARGRLYDSERVSYVTLCEFQDRVRAFHKEEATKERLEALDAEMMLRRYFSHVAKGELHRDLVEEDLTREHNLREQSPEGRKSRRVLQEWSNWQDNIGGGDDHERSSTVHSGERRNYPQHPQPRQAYAATENVSRLSQVSPLAMSPYAATPVGTVKANAQGPSKGAGDVSRSRVGGFSELPPVPMSPEKRSRLQQESSSTSHRATTTTVVSERNASMVQRGSMVQEDRSSVMIDLEAAKRLKEEVDYNIARRRYKKALMEQVLS